MIGDHHQLPPVVQNIAFQKYSNMEQSLFARFVRLGVPHVLLNQQGRARAEYVLGIYILGIIRIILNRIFKLSEHESLT